MREGDPAERGQRPAPLLLIVAVALVTACGVAGANDAEATDMSSQSAKSPSDTWATEIDVCVAATMDPSGCQWLAGLLIHRRCAMRTYQTLASGLAMGASFEVMYREAFDNGECGAEPDSNSATSQIEVLSEWV
jgi:hypothetical protein